MEVCRLSSPSQNCTLHLEIFGWADMPQHSVIENFQLAFVSIQYFFRQRLWQSPTESFRYTVHDPKTFFKRMKILIYYLFLEFDIANEKQTRNVN